MSQAGKQLGFEAATVLPKRVSVTLKSLPGRKNTTDLTNAVFDLACALG